MEARARLRSLRLSAAVLLLLWILPARVDAQQFVCRPIAPGDTASSLARRLTGKAEAAYGHAFQIRDPARRMFVPKSHYQRLRADWQACIARAPIASTPAAPAPVVEVAAWPARRDEPPVAPTPETVATAPVLLAGAGQVVTDGPGAVSMGAVALSIVLLSALAGSLRRRSVPDDARRAGENFLTVFARPLVDPSSGLPPIETRVRYRRRSQQLEIAIAPGPGHRYPNLADHKKNLEYDIERVMSVLGNYVLSAPPRASGKWVVLAIKPSEDVSKENA